MISACLIIGDERDGFEKWLADSSSYADEIVIIDTSKDGYPALPVGQEIQLPCVVTQFPWDNDFAAARNMALDLANGDWIVFLDADEFFVEPSNVRHWVSEHIDSKCEGVLVPIINVDEDTYGQEISRFPALRIWRNKRSYRYEGKIHEALYCAGNPLKNVIMEPGLQVIHTGYSAHKIKQKLRRNLEILLQENKEYGENPRKFRYLAECYEGLGEPSKAFFYVRRALREEPPVLAGRAGIYRTGLQAIQDLDLSVEDQLTFINLGLDSGEAGLEMLLDKAILLLAKNNIDEAERCTRYFIQRAEAIKQDLTETTTVLAMLPVAEGLLGRILISRDAWKQGEHWLALALHHNPYQMEVLTAWKTLCDYTGKNFHETLKEFYDNQDLYKKFLMQWCMAEGHIECAEVFYPQIPLREAWRCRTAEKVYQDVEKNGTERYFALVYTMLSGGAELAKSEPCLWREWISLLPRTIAAVIKVWVGEEKCIKQEDFLGYSAILMILSKEGKDAVLDKYTDMIMDFSPKEKMESVHSLVKYERWKQAYVLLDSIAPEEITGNGNYWYMMGKCAYFLHIPQAAVYFDKARQNGVESGDIEAFLKWLNTGA